ncbi:MAG: acetoacetate decarboxylase family protein [Gemmatimonadetes bacterium]|nr:acetoacetate decarboxylase family protein [Gemmatimonadota bacterium]
MVTNRVAGGLDLQLKHEDGWNIPASNPFYPPLPAVYRNVRFQFVFFHAAPDAVQGFLPEPLEAAEDGLCVASGLEVPCCENYGSFEESFIVMKCHLGNQTGFYCSHVFHNGPAGIAAGREIYGTPKVYADLKVMQADRRMVTETSYGGTRVLHISTRMETDAPHDAMPSLTPAWRLKIIPRADGPGPAIKQLIDCTETAQDVDVHAFSKGKGTVGLGAAPRCDLTSLAPLEYGDAFHMESSYSEGFARVVYDYLSEEL